MPRMWLPTQYVMKDANTMRQQVLIIPGAEYMDKGQLEEILAWQREKTAKELARPREQPTHSRQEVGLRLKEYREWLRRKA